MKLKTVTNKKQEIAGIGNPGIQYVSRRAEAVAAKERKELFKNFL